MKNKIAFLPLTVLLLLLFQCSDERIEPTLTEDLKTSANAYADQFLTIGVTKTADHSTIEFWLSGNEGEMSINWGDGTIQKNVSVANEYVSFWHHYDDNKNYSIVISGEISQITEIILEDQNMKINSIHLGGLPKLRTLVLDNLPNGPQVLNLSRNRSIEYLKTSRTSTISDIILPTSNELIGLDITGNNKLTTSIVDRLIARVHDSVVNNPRSGEITIRSGIDGDAATTMIGPPSSYSINKLRKLQNVYGWKVTPGIQ